MFFETDPDSGCEPDDADLCNADGSMTGRRALVATLIDRPEVARLGQILAKPTSQLVLLVVPAPGWAAPVAAELNRRFTNARAKAFLDPKKDGNSGPATDMIERLEKGRHLVLVTHDAHGVLPAFLLAAVDESLTVGALDAKFIQQAIRKLTGRAVPKVNEQNVGDLDFSSLLCALRPGSTPAECVRRLARLTERSRQPISGHGVPRLEDLPLGAEVASWSFSLLDQLRRVDARVLAPSELSYAILFGPPGTGKTLLVSALARSANWRLVQTSVGSWFSESDGYLGGVSKRITGFFDDLLGATSSIGFIDEVEAIPNRMALGPKDREYWTPVVTLLLLQIDRLRRSGRPVLLLSATNFLERLDPAITRSGRLERHVPVLPPRSLEEVSAVLKHHLGGALDTSTIKAVARLSKGKTPADIEALVRTARSAAAAAGRSLEASDLMSVLVPSDPRDPVELRATALHEAGHAVVALAMSHEIEGASIIAEGKTGGSVKGLLPSRFPNRQELEAITTVLLGGRAADVIFGKGAHAGAEHDLEMATDMLRKGIEEMGLYGRLTSGTSLIARREVDEQIEEALQRLFKWAMLIVRQESEAVKVIADALLLHRVLDGADLLRIFASHRSGHSLPPVEIEAAGGE